METLATYCCGLNIWSEKAIDIFNIPDEEKETFRADPKLGEDKDYPEWLWDPKLLLDIDTIKIEDIDQEKDPELYWKKVIPVPVSTTGRLPTVNISFQFELEQTRYNEFYFDQNRFTEAERAHPANYEFISHFPDIEIKPRSQKLKDKIIRSAPYANQ